MKLVTYQDPYKKISHVLRFMQREEVSTKSRPIEDWRNDSTVGQYFGIDQVWGKIPCICNFLIFISDSWDW